MTARLRRAAAAAVAEERRGGAETIRSKRERNPEPGLFQNLSENRVETDVMGIVKRSMDHLLGQD